MTRMPRVIREFLQFISEREYVLGLSRKFWDFEMLFQRDAASQLVGRYLRRRKQTAIIGLRACVFDGKSQASAYRLK
jgi:hypothetical protein